MGQKFGAELEMTQFKADGGDVTDAAIRAAIRPHTHRLNPRATGWYKSDGRTWDMKTDSTCGWELASPAMTLNDTGHNTELENVCGALEALGVICNHKCGTHVHLELADYDWRDLQRLMILWVRYEPFFFSLQPANRRSKTYCAPLYRKEWIGYDSSNYSRAQAACRATSQTVFDREARRLGGADEGGDRLALNIGGFWRNRRIEVRLHSGTINYHKIRHWVMLLSALVARPKLTTMPEIVMMGTNRNPTGLSTEYICKQLGLLPSRFLPEVPQESIELSAWLEQRRQQFSSRPAAPAIPAPAVTVGVNPVTILPEIQEGEVRRCAAIVGHLAGRGRGMSQWGEPGNSCGHVAITNRRGCAIHTIDWNSGHTFRRTDTIGRTEMTGLRDINHWTDVRQVPDDRTVRQGQNDRS